MPFYEYACKACGAHHEAMQKMSDSPLKKCPACGRLQLARQLSAPVFRLKGGGWYETDFKSDKEAKRNLHGEDKADTSTAATADAKAETKGETKPEAKSDSKSDTKSDAKSDGAPAPKAEAATTEPKAASRAAAKSSTSKSARAAPPKRAKATTTGGRRR